MVGRPPRLVPARTGRHRQLARATLGDVLSNAVDRDGRSFPELALLLGTSHAVVSQWCDDLLDPWPENFDALTEYLGIDLDELGALVIRSQSRRAARTGRAAYRHPSGGRIAN